MTGLVFLHGWGYGPQTWDSLVAALRPAPVIVLDAGYFGPPDLPSSLPERLKDILPANPDGWLGVGHSLGFARLLQMDVSWRGLVGIGGFLRFCQKSGQSTGTSTDMLDAMLARLDTAPQDVLARFHKRCGHRVTPLPLPSAASLERLRADLELLRDLDLSPDLARPRRPVPTLLLHAQDDRIVPTALAEEAQALLPGSRLTLLTTGGHALPMTRPHDCQRLVREFLHDLS